MIKAIFFDIDGTLVSFKTHKVPQSTIDALNLLREKGIKIFIATGRHPSIIGLGNNINELKIRVRPPNPRRPRICIYLPSGIQTVISLFPLFPQA